jgi:ATP adenylyltransferase
VDVLWSPWRYSYIKSAATDSQVREDYCVFCEVQQTDDDKSRFILHRAQHNFIILNIYPYITGHLLIVPYAHVSDLDIAAKEITDEMMDLTKLAQKALREVYQPHGFNLGMNLGRAAGAGVASHIHQHIMPRWSGDANFVTTISETRVIPEDLEITYEKLHSKF